MLDRVPLELPDAAQAGTRVRLSDVGAALTAPTASRGIGRLFDPGAQGATSSLAEVWAGKRGWAWRRSGTGILGPSLGGYPPLRVSIAPHLFPVCGQRVTADRVIIAARPEGTLSRLASVLLYPGDAVWMEGPGYPLVARLLVHHGVRIVAIAADE